MIPYKDDNPSKHFPFVNTFFIAVNVIVFLAQVSLPEGKEWMWQYAMIPKIFWSNPVANAYRILTSMFMHGGWLHIGGNMLFLWIFGDNVEDAFGHFGYFFFYLLSGVCGALLQSAISPFSPIPMVGASGAISGVIAAYVLFYPTAKVHTLIFLFIFVTTIRIPAFVFIFIWIAEQVLNGVLSLPGMGSHGGTAYFAHIGGIAFGFFAALKQKKKVTRKNQSLYR